MTVSPVINISKLSCFVRNYSLFWAVEGILVTDLLCKLFMETVFENRIGRVLKTFQCSSNSSLNMHMLKKQALRKQLYRKMFYR